MDPASFNIADVRDKIGIGQDLLTADKRFGEIGSAGADVLPVQTYFDLLSALSSAMGVMRRLSTSPPAGVPSEAWSALAADGLDSLLIDYVARTHNGVAAILLAAGVFEADAIDEPSTPGRVPYTRWRIEWGRLPLVVTDPSSLMGDLYGWRAESGLNYELLFARLARTSELLGLPIEVRSPTPGRLDEFYDSANQHRGQIRELGVTLISGQDFAENPLEVSLLVIPIPEQSDRGGAPRGLAISHELTVSAAPPTELFAPYSVDLESSGARASVEGGTVRLLPSGVSAELPSGQPTIDVKIALGQTSDAANVLVGSVFSHRIELFGYSFGLRVSGPIASPDLVLTADVTDGRVVVDASESDGFLTSVLGGTPWSLRFAVGIEWSSQTGLHFRGGGLERAIPLDIGLATARLTRLVLGLKSDKATLALNAGLDAEASLGPIAVAVSNVGVRIAATRVPDESPSGIFGDLDLRFGFKPPDGVGLSIDASPVLGSGYLQLDPTAGRYVGAVSISVLDVDVAAVGLLDTRTPSGGSAFSLIVLASAEFPPVQLGFGVELNGLGGLLALNRTADINALQAIARSGGLEGLMFPADAQHNLARVIADLGRAFPAADGQFVLGPSAKLAWGSTDFLVADLAVFIQPTASRAILLGAVTLTAPDAEAPVAVVHLDVLGVIDFAQQTLAIDASLRDSKLAGFTLTGQAALRAGWGRRAAFVLAIGGFNPHFAAPAGFPALQRVALALGGDNPRLRMSAYFALTSNTVQFGAQAELYAAAGPAAVRATMAFDALVQLKPFGLTFDLVISAELLLGGSSLCGISLKLHVSGPDPWHVTGRASVSFLFFSVSVPINLTIGPSAPPVTVSRPDVASMVAQELQLPRSWSSVPPGAATVVTLRSTVGESAIVVHPLATLAVQQRLAPLNTRIDRYGADLLAAPCRLALSDVTVNGASAATAELVGMFAPGQFVTVSDAQRLAEPSFEPMPAGVAIGSSALVVPADGDGSAVATPSTTTWTSKILDVHDAPKAPDSKTEPSADLLAIQLEQAAAAVRGAAARGRNRYAGKRSGIQLKDPDYRITGRDLGVGNRALSAAVGALANRPHTTFSDANATITTATRPPAGVQSRAATALARSDVQVVYASELPGATSKEPA